ncbi:b(0,+)-type amino acid transporter 1, partial [Armadillidium nasatum]
TDEGRSTSKEDEKVSLKKNIGFTSCVGIIIGTVIGSGIFISPIGVLLESGSVGLTLIIWALCGFFSFMGALSFTELATLLPSSGGQYIYLLEGFAPNRKSEKLFWGPLLAFLFSMEETFFSRPASSAVQALSISTYLLNLGKLGCASGSSENEVVQIKLMASCFVVVITTINCYSVKFSTGVINVFTALKLLALFVIITGGVLTLSSGETGALKTGNLSKAMLTSFIVITTVYLATNISYFALMSKEEFIASDAVAVDLGLNFLDILEEFT